MKDGQWRAVMLAIVYRSYFQ